MSLKKTLVGAVAVVSTLTVAGCGGATDIAGSHGAIVTKSGFAAALSQATSQARSVHVNGTITAEGQSISLTADAASSGHSVNGTSAVVTVALPAMGSVEARIVDGVVYLKGAQSLLGDNGGKTWVKIDLTDGTNPIGSMLGQVTDSVGPGQFSDLLKGLSKVTEIGPETVDGVPTTRYTVSVDTAKLGSKLGSVLGADPSQLGGKQLPKTVSYDVWLDSASRPVKLATGTSDYSVDLHFSKWGEPVHVVAPPASQVSSFGF